MTGGRTGIVYSDVYLRHDTGGHPESAQRLRAIMAGLQEKGLLDRLVRIEPKKATVEEIASVHDRTYILWAEEMIQKGAHLLDFIETVVSQDSFEAALYAAGGVLAAIDAIGEGVITNCFCAVRPPGHHALSDRAMGFCVFNNVAIGARYVQKKYGIERVLIVDWDVHHGNGTQGTFYADPTVFYFSTHQFPHYPGSGDSGEVGEGKGRGYTLNVPMRGGAGDEEYVAAFQELLVPAMEEFRPEFILISAGFDGHRRDPLAGIDLTTEGYGRLTSIVRGMADRHASGRLVSVLEGGYDLDALSDSVAEHIWVLMEEGDEE